MAKTDKTTNVTNRNTIALGSMVLGGPVADIVIAVDIANVGANFTRSSVQTDLDAAETAAIALAQSSGKPTRVTINGAEYQVYSRGQG